MVLPVLILLVQSESFGWGNLTHVYLVKEVGKPRGLVNLLETYGCLVTDVFNLRLDQSGQTLAHQLHNNPGPFAAHARGCQLKAVAFGVWHHNEPWGVDRTAHTNGLTQGQDDGWIVYKAQAMAPEVVPVVEKILNDAGFIGPAATEFAKGLAPELGHVLAESAVDILVRREMDPRAGGRLALAAMVRPASVGPTLVKAYGGTPGVTMTAAEIIAAEVEFQQQMIQYGQIFLLPEPLLVQALAAATVPVAEMYIEAALYSKGLVLDVSVSEETVAESIVRAIGYVQGDYQAELAATLDYIRDELDARGIETCRSIFPLWKEGEPEVDVARVPSTFELGQNYPNPFNPSTTIAYALPVDTRVTLSVYNALGQEVATLVDGDMPAGMHAATWDATGFASGVYFYRIAAGDFTEVKRLVLTR
jgi:hypothetical protein